jgi:hypothetical protein
MNNIRWANPEHIGICYDNGDVVVYIDSGDLYDSIIAGNYGPIADPQVIEGGPAVVYTPEEITALRQAAYQAESDPIYFMWQRGESTEGKWKAQIDIIKARYPYPDGYSAAPSSPTPATGTIPTEVL